MQLTRCYKNNKSTAKDIFTNYILVYFLNTINDFEVYFFDKIMKARICFQ